MGWIGWSEARTLDTTIPAILMAYEGRADMLKAIFGSSEENMAPSEPKPKQSLGQALRAIAAQRRPEVNGT